MKFTGVMPALITPLHEDETVNVPVLEQLIRALLAQGADGFYIAGATGEGLSLRPAQRRVLAEAAISVVDKKKPCIIHVASTDFNEALALAKHAQSCGADAISAIPPLFYKYDEEDVYQYYKALAESVRIPLVIYYNMAAGFAINAKFAARMFEVDNITAIKWTSPDYHAMMQLKNLTHGEMNIINGPDQTLLMGLSAGADAGIGTTYNYMMPFYRAIFDHFRAGEIDRAQQYQFRVANVIANLRKYPGIPAAKALLEHMGYAVGRPAFPMKRLTDAQKQDVFEIAGESGWTSSV